MSTGSRNGDPGALEARLAAVEQDLNAMRGELSETQERLDFTERLLSQAREGKATRFTVTPVLDRPAL